MVIVHYSKYAVVGAVVAVIAIGIRELIAWMLPSDTPVYYSISILVAYLCGFILSYLGHKYFSFSHVKKMAFSRGQSMGAFVLIALLGMHDYHASVTQRPLPVTAGQGTG